MSAALESPVAEVAAAILEQSVANVDETSWPEGNKTCWLWVAVTPIATMFLLRLSRGAAVVKELLSEAFAGIVGSDRWSGYNWLGPKRRQVCWAHLLRDFEALVLRGGVSEPIGLDLQCVSAKDVSLMAPGPRWNLEPNLLSSGDGCYPAASRKSAAARGRVRSQFDSKNLSKSLKA